MIQLNDIDFLGSLASLQVNQMDWSNDTFPSLIDSRIEQTTPIQKVVIERIKCSSNALNELIQSTTIRISAEIGLMRLNLFKFPRNC